MMNNLEHRLKNVSNKMSSLQIAEITGKNHAHVMRDIRNMVEKINESSRGLVKEESKSEKDIAKANGKYKGMSNNVVDAILDTFNKECSLQGYTISQQTYVDTKGETRAMYVLNKKASLLLASSYNHLLRMKIIDRWEQLETERQKAFQVPQTYSQALLLASQQAAKIEEQQKQIEFQQQENKQLASVVKSMECKVTYLDKILACPSTVKVKTIAQDYGMSAIAFNQLLHKCGIQYKCGDVWVLYAKYLPNGYVKDVPFNYTRSDGSVGMNSNTQWTQKGRMFLYNFLKERNVLPLIER